MTPTDLPDTDIRAYSETTRCSTAAALLTAADYLDTHPHAWPTSRMRAVAAELEAQADDDADLEEAARLAYESPVDNLYLIHPWEKTGEINREFYRAIARRLRDRYRKETHA